MSAFVVDADHIDYLVTATMKLARTPYGIGSVPISAPQADDIRDLGGAGSISQFTTGRFLWNPEHNPDTLGSILLAENIRSVRARYPEDTLDELPGPRPMVTPEQYVWRYVPAEQISHAQTIRAIECWQYQTCEYSEHEHAAGWQATQNLYRAAVRELTRDADVQWEWTRARATPTSI